MRFRTRSQEVEAMQLVKPYKQAIEWTGGTKITDADGRSFAFLVMPNGVQVHPGEWIVKHSDGRLEMLWEARFRADYVPVPDLIRTVADYEGLPAGSIIEMVDTSDVLVRWCPGQFRCNGYMVWAAELVERDIVCSVVRLGGSQ
mgnify:FL=1